MLVEIRLQFRGGMVQLRLDGVLRTSLQATDNAVRVREIAVHLAEPRWLTTEAPTDSSGSCRILYVNRPAAVVALMPMAASVKHSREQPVD